MERFAETELRLIRQGAWEAVTAAAQRFEAGVKVQLGQRFRVKDKRFLQGVRVYRYGDDNSVTAGVSLGRLQSSFTERTVVQGDPWLWILLPEGKKRRLDRIDAENPWQKVQALYKGRLTWVDGADGGKVLLLQERGRSFPLYKLQRQVETEQRLKLEPLEWRGFEEMLRILGEV